MFSCSVFISFFLEAKDEQDSEESEEEEGEEEGTESDLVRPPFQRGKSHLSAGNLSS